MKKDDVLEHFGTLEKVAATLGISVSAVSQWGDTAGKLKVKHSLYRNRSK